MADGFVLPRESGRRIRGSGMLVKVGDDQSKHWSAFEVQVPPGFDVGAHLHRDAEELFYILEGELELLAFEPRVRTKENWRAWESKTGAKVVRGGEGSAMFVPSGCPHAFMNPGTALARMLFFVAPPGHEHYQDEIGELLSHGGPPDPATISRLRARYDIEQLTPLNTGRGVPSPGQAPTTSRS
jgi:mannose-6-phosphate isomerase-like protein (cupin superfamily)